MYWGLAYGVSAGLLLFLVSLLSKYIGLVWAPFFVAGLVWGGYRNYNKQKKAAGATATGTPLQEFRQAVSDIADVSQEVFNQDATPQDEAPFDAASGEPIEPTEGQPPAPPPPAAPPTPPQQ